MNGSALRTDTVLIPIIDGELADPDPDPDPDTTVEFRPPWLLPPVTRRYRSRRAYRDEALGWLGVAVAVGFFFGGIRLAYELADLVGLTR